MVQLRKPRLVVPVSAREVDRPVAAAAAQRLEHGPGGPPLEGRVVRGRGRGLTVLHDFMLRDPQAHLDPEAAPGPAAAARAVEANGTFECHRSLEPLTRAQLFSAPGLRTRAFVRFSVLGGERAAGDTVRATRGFAVKFASTEGDWDLMGCSLPVYPVHDATELPPLAGALVAEAYWDFVASVPEALHHALWLMGDRGLPRSYRTMQGFGVETVRWVNAAGEPVFVKLHWLPRAGTHALAADEAARLCTADPDFLRRDLREAIDGGRPPVFELGIQVVTEDEAQALSLHDATRLLPEDEVPIQIVGRLVLERCPAPGAGDAAARAFSRAHRVPGIEPHRLAPSPARFADPLSQPQRYWASLTEPERAHIVSAIRHELGRVGTLSIRERVVTALAMIDDELAAAVAAGIGAEAPLAQPSLFGAPVRPSPRLSLRARPGDGTVPGWRVAVMVAEGVDAASWHRVQRLVTDAGAQVRTISHQAGRVEAADGERIAVDTTFDQAPSVLWDAMVMLPGAETELLRGNGQVLEFVRQQYRHCKPMLLLGDAGPAVAVAHLPTVLRNGEPDPGLFVADDEERSGAALVAGFAAALARHRPFERECDPPVV